MKLPLLLLLFVMTYACKPHYDFSKIRTDLKTEVKSDSLVYQTVFKTSDTAWHYAGKISAAETDDHTIFVDTVGRIVQGIAPAGRIDFDYSIATKVKIDPLDSTDLGYAGFIFDRIDSAYYRMLFISNKGTFYLKDVCNGEEEILIPKINSRFLNKGGHAFNNIEIRHRRKRIYILFNGNVAAVCKLNKVFSYGAVGIVVSTTENNKQYSPVKAMFGDFVVKKIKTEE